MKIWIVFSALTIESYLLAGVKDHFPLLYQAFIDEIGNEPTDEFFSRWSESEFKLLKKCLHFLPNSREMRREANVLHDSYTQNLVGCLFEADTSAQSRLLSKAFGWEFVSTEHYDRLNPHGSRPDGILLVRDARKQNITIHRIVESKSMGAGFSVTQAQKTLAHWAEYGITLYWNNDPVHYPPEKILVSTDAGMKPLADIKSSDFESVYLVFSHQPQTRLQNINFLIDHRTSVKIANRYLFTLYGLELKASSIPLVSEESELSRRFRTFFLRELRLPLKESKDREEAELAYALHREGLQDFITRKVDPAFQLYMGLFEIYPRKEALEQVIECIGPNHPKTPAFLEIYRRAYSEDPHEAPSFFQNLIRKSLVWKHYFKNHWKISLPVIGGFLERCRNAFRSAS